MHEPLCPSPSLSVASPTHSLRVPCSSCSLCHYPSICSAQVNVRAHDHAEPQHPLWSVRLAAADSPARPAFGGCGMRRWCSGKGTASRHDSWDQHVKWLQQSPHSPWQQVQPLAADRGGAGRGTCSRHAYAPSCCCCCACVRFECQCWGDAEDFRRRIASAQRLPTASGMLIVGDNGWPMVAGSMYS